MLAIRCRDPYPSLGFGLLPGRRRCNCVPAWTGTQCESLNLLRTPAALGYHAVARNETVEKTASWGGSVVVGDDGTYHM